MILRSCHEICQVAAPCNGASTAVSDTAQFIHIAIRVTFRITKCKRCFSQLWITLSVVIIPVKISFDSKLLGLYSLSHVIVPRNIMQLRVHIVMCKHELCYTCRQILLISTDNFRSVRSQCFFYRLLMYYGISYYIHCVSDKRANFGKLQFRIDKHMILIILGERHQRTFGNYMQILRSLSLHFYYFYLLYLLLNSCDGKDATPAI